MSCYNRHLTVHRVKIFPVCPLQITDLSTSTQTQHHSCLKSDSPLNTRWGPFQSSVLREIPRSLWKLKRVLDILDASQEVPWHTRPHLRGSPSFLAHLNLSPFSPPHLEMRVDSPAFSGKESRRSCHTSRGGWSQIETQDETSWFVPQSQRHKFPHPLEIRHDAPEPIWMEHRVSSHNTKGHWHPVASSKKRCRFQIQLDKRPDIPFTTQEASRMPSQNTRQGLPPLFKLQRNSDIDVRNGEGPWGSHLSSRWVPIHPCSNTRGIPRCLLQLESRSDFPEETQAGPPGLHATPEEP